MNERIHKGRLRPDKELSFRLKKEAEGLIPEMQSLFASNAINNAIVKLVGSTADGLADDKSDFDYLFDRESHAISDLVNLIKATYNSVGPEVQKRTSHRIEAHFPETEEFNKAFHQSGEYRMSIIT